MIVAVPKEFLPGERRVAATPDTTKRLIKLGLSVRVQAGAGDAAGFADATYKEAGAEIAATPEATYAGADVVIKVRPPAPLPAGAHELDRLREGAVLISFVWPGQSPDLLKRMAARKVSVLAMDAVPRISRAQKLDALSSMANVSGYRAVVEAANVFPRFFMGQITAAGKVPPGKVLVIGAGVAGLAAIGAARGLGAIVRAFDTRPAVREQVQSMGAEFLEVTIAEDGTGEGGYSKEMSPAFIAAEMALFAAQAKDVDVIITTALIPGKKAPTLITEEMVNSMRPGSVVVDLAAEQGGNCALTKPGEVVVKNGVSVIGYTDLPSRMASQSSQLYGTNIAHLLDEMGGGASFKVDTGNEIVRGALVTHQGEITWPPPKPAAPQAASAPAAAKPSGGNGASAPTAKPAPSSKPSSGHGHGAKKGGEAKAGSLGPLLAAGIALMVVGVKAPPSFLTHLLVFVLSCFVGWQVIWNVTPALHTPLMSVTNAISGIILVGGMLQLSGPLSSPSTILGAAAVLVATINIAGGFLVTQRMLQMFRK